MKTEKRILSVLMAVLLLLSAPIPVYAETEAVANTTEFAGGTGTAEDPYIITTMSHLNNVRNYLDAHFRMDANIEFTDTHFASGGIFYNNGKGWLPIGNATTPFTGSFDGNGHTITDLQVKASASSASSYVYAGLFGYADNASIKNLGLLNGSISGSVSSSYFYGVYAGSLVGYVNSNTTITECYNTGSVTASSCSAYAGGLVGYVSTSGCTLTACYNTGTVSATAKTSGSSSTYAYAGGIVAYISNYSSVANCYNTGNITGNNAEWSSTSYFCSYAGGITGGSGKIFQCYNTGVVTAKASSSDCKRYSGAISGAGNQVESCYYIEGCALNAAGTNLGTACTAEQMQKQATYRGFDFDTVWTLAGNSGYALPALQSLENIHTKKTLSITMATAPQKLSYQTGEPLDVTGGQIQVSYHDGSTETVDMTADVVSGFYSTRVGTQNLTVTYAGRTTNFSVIIEEYDNTNFADGWGTAENPYIITTKEHLKNVNLQTSAHYRMDADIVFTEADFASDGAFYNNGKGWEPISTFSGVFDGNGHTVTGLQINCTSVSNVGLFKAMSGGAVKNLGMVDSKIVAQSKYDMTVGGIVGTVNGGTIINCYNTGSVTAENTCSYNGYYTYVGGIAGWRNGSAVITDCYNTGVVTGNADSCGVYAGGIVGNSNDSTSMTNVYNTGAATAVSDTGLAYAGGIAGNFNGGTITDAYNTGDISASGGTGDVKSGGILGHANATMMYCHNTGKITATTTASSFYYALAGGIAGKLNSGTAKICYNTGEVLAIANISEAETYAYAGGIAGICGTIINCYNIGTVHAEAVKYAYVGGIVAQGGYSAVRNCYNAGSVYAQAPASTVCGIIGNGWASNTASNTYYLDSISVGVGSQTDSAVKCTAAQLRQEQTFQGFDFLTVWTTDGDTKYPVFLPKLQSVVLTTQPDKLTYMKDEEALDVTGGQLTLTYEDSTSRTVAMTEAMVTGFDHSALGKQTLTVTCGSKTVCYQVEVIAKKLVSIAVSTEPSELTWLEADATLYTSGGELTLTYNNDTTEIVALTADMLSGYDKTVNGDQTLTVTYEGMTTAYTVQIGITHSWSDWTQLKAATCTENGKKMHKCTVCSKAEIATIPAFGHSDTSVITTPTCTEQGYTTNTCTVCGCVTVTDYEDALGHSYTTVTTPATCTADGSIVKTCSVCKEVVTEVIPAKGHNWSDWIVLTDPTCKADGEQVRMCDCGELEYGAIPKLAHSYVDGICTNCHSKVPYIYSASLTLESILRLNYTLELNGLSAEDCEIHVTFGEDAGFQTLTGSYEASIPSYRLHEPVTAKLLYQGEVLETKVWTFDGYSNSLREEHGEDTKMMALLDTLSDYATFANYYATPGGTAPDNSEVNAVDRTELSAYKLSILTGNRDLGATASLYLDDACDILVKFNAAAFEGCTLYVDGTAVVTEIADGKAVYRISEILPQDLSKFYNIKVVNADGVTIYEVDYSVLSYAYTALSRTQEIRTGLNGLLKAMYLYSLSASAYHNA